MMTKKLEEHIVIIDEVANYDFSAIINFLEASLRIGMHIIMIHNHKKRIIKGTITDVIARHKITAVKKKYLLL